MKITPEHLSRAACVYIGMMAGFDHAHQLSYSSFTASGLSLVER